MDRIEKIRAVMDGVLLEITDEKERQNAAVHLYGVSQYCAMLAMKRGEDVELAVIAGMMHDIYSYSAMETKDHAHKGAEMARGILISMDAFSDQEVEQICSAVYHHSSKRKVHAALDEVLKDADVLAHCLYHPGLEVVDKEKKRWDDLKKELGLIS